MPRTPRFPALLAFIAAFSSFGVAAEANAPATLEAVTHAPHAFVIKDLRWAEGASGGAIRWVSAGTAADFKVLRAEEALARRSAGEALKAVFVVSRQASDYHLLVVREDFLANRPEMVESVVGMYERARRWLIAHPLEAAALVAQETGGSASAAQAALAGREFNVSRPGPALAQALRTSANSVRSAQVDALLDDGPMRAATRKLEQGPQPVPQPVIVSLR